MSHDEEIRLFFGFEVHSPWPETFAGGKLIKEDLRHITLAFLGNTPKDKVPNLIKEIPRPSWSLGHVGIFDQILFLPESRPRVVSFHAIHNGDRH